MSFVVAAVPTHELLTAIKRNLNPAFLKLKTRSKLSFRAGFNYLLDNNILVNTNN
jgi:hypothetical protein